jgi:hypothetical protein
MKKFIFIGIIAVLIGIQFISIDKTNPTVDDNKDFIRLTNPPAEIGILIKNACYDCHSHNTKYPWYTDVAPVSWLIKEHINNGRRNLNFSTWPDYQESKKAHKIDECIEVVKSGEMPMKAYVMLHEEAEFSQDQKMALLTWFNVLRDSLK